MIESKVIQEIASHYAESDASYSLILSPILHKRIYVLTKLTSRLPYHKHRTLRKCKERRITKRRKKEQQSIVKSYERLYNIDHYAPFLHPDGFSCVRNNPLPIIVDEEAMKSIATAFDIPVTMLETVLENIETEK